MAENLGNQVLQRLKKLESDLFKLQAEVQDLKEFVQQDQPEISVELLKESPSRA